MYNKNDLINDLRNIGILKGVSDIYGRGSVIELDVEPKYSLYVAESNISPCFFNVTKNVINKIVDDDKDFCLILMDNRGNKLYAYDQKCTMQLLSKVSYEKVYGNYRVTEKDLYNPITYENFYEFLTTL